jgi:hypothetical protein
VFRNLLHYSVIRHHKSELFKASSSRGSSVGIVTRLRAAEYDVQSLVWVGDFSVLLNLQSSSEDNPASYSVGTGVLSRT